MQSQQQMKDTLKHLSSTMARIHKALMDYQMSERELQLGENLMPGTKLQMLLNDPEFQWLRVLSQLMTLVDDGLFQKEPLTLDQVKGLQQQVRDLFIQQTHQAFSEQYRRLSQVIPEIRQYHEQLLQGLDLA